MNLGKSEERKRHEYSLKEKTKAVFLQWLLMKIYLEIHLNFVQKTLKMIEILKILFNFAFKILNINICLFHSLAQWFFLHYFFFLDVGLWYYHASPQKNASMIKAKTF